MGISIEQYRFFISSFNRYRKSDQKVKKSDSFDYETKKMFRLVVFLLFLNGLSLVTVSSVSKNDSLVVTKDILNKSSRPCKVNFLARYKFGNIGRKGINICHWNKGSGFMLTKLYEIENLIQN